MRDLDTMDALFSQADDVTVSIEEQADEESSYFVMTVSRHDGDEEYVTVFLFTGDGDFVTVLDAFTRPYESSATQAPGDA